MKPTADDATPRRDGWYEHKATWGEVVLGTFIADTQKRSKRWEIVDVANGDGQIPQAHTLWMRAREVSSGEEFTISPRLKTSPIVILTQDPAETRAGDPSPASDSEAVRLLVEKLGAQILATHHASTGEVHCPDYVEDSHLEGHGSVLRGLIEHLAFAHGEKVEGDQNLANVITVHGQAHNPAWPNFGKGGFPHRHVPEDLTIYTGTRS